MIDIKRENIAYLKIAAFTLLNLAFFSSGFYSFYEKWFQWGSYYTHSPLVVIAFVCLLIKRIKDNKHSFKNNSLDFSGLIIISFSLIIYLTGLWKNIQTFTTWSIYLFVFGNSVLFLGKNFILKNIGIYIYLLVAIPVPQLIIDRLTFELNLFASYASEIFISIIYPSTIRNGNILQVKGYYIAISHECSGLSNLLSMFSVTWLLALFQTKKIITVIDYLLSIPAAIISNILRIIIVTVLVVNGYEQFALYDWHSEIGIAVFILIVILIALFNEFPFKKNDFSFKISFPGQIVSYFNKNNKFINAYIIIMLIVTIAGFILPDKNNYNNSDNEILLKDKIPGSIGRWKSQDEMLGENYFSILGTNDLLMREYWEKGNNTETGNVYLYIIRSKNNMSAFHRPEVCLRGEGYELLTHSEKDLNLTDKKTISVHRMLFTDEDKGLLVYYWYYINGKNLKNTIKYQLAFLFNKNEDSGGNFIRISKPVNLNNITQEEQKMKQFAKEVIPGILEYL